MKNIKNLIFLLTAFLLTNALFGQQVILDQQVTAGGVTFFPTIGNPNEYYYLPDKIQVGRHTNGKPQFSFTRYVRNNESVGSTTGDGLTNTADAGAILHALVMLKVPAEMLNDAKRELTRINSQAVVKGAVSYKSGKIAIISSIIGTDGDLTKKVVGIGDAPVLEGNKAAVSVLLTKEGAELLWATFQTPTPDLSFQFSMDIAGYQSPKQVKIEANFEQIYSHQSFEAAAVTPVLSAEIRTAFEELNNTGAIKLTQIGSDERLEKLKDAAYDKLTSLIFDRVGGQSGSDFSQLLPSQQKGVLDRATEMLNKARTEANTENLRRETVARNDQQAETRRARSSSRAALDSIYTARGIDNNPFAGDHDRYRNGGEAAEKVPELAVAISYVTKRVRRTGNYVVDLNKYNEEIKSFPFSENLGNLKSCTTCFNIINVDNPATKERTIKIRLIDFNTEDFNKYVSNVEVLFKKEHQNGSSTLKNMVIDKKLFNENGNNFSLLYGWKGDTNRRKWLQYQYKTKWTFSGGITIESDWQTATSGVISLVPDLVKKEIFVELDPDFISDENIIAAEVKLHYNYEEQADTRTLNFKVRDNILAKSAQLILPKDQDKYTYEVIWHFKGKDPQTSSITDGKYANLYFQKF